LAWPLVRWLAARRYEGSVISNKNTADVEGGPAYRNGTIISNYFFDLMPQGSPLWWKRANFIEPNERVLYLHKVKVKIVECPRQRSCTTHPPRRTHVMQGTVTMR